MVERKEAKRWLNEMQEKHDARMTKYIVSIDDYDGAESYMRERIAPTRKWEKEKGHATQRIQEVERAIDPKRKDAADAGHTRRPMGRATYQTGTHCQCDTQTK